MGVDPGLVATGFGVLEAGAGGVAVRDAGVISTTAGQPLEVRLNARVTGVDDEGVMIGDERIRSQSVFWAAGNAASPLGQSLEVPLDRAGRA